MKFANLILKIWWTDNNKVKAIFIGILLAIAIALGRIIIFTILGADTIDSAYLSQDVDGFKNEVTSFISEGASLKELPEGFTLENVFTENGKVVITMEKDFCNFIFPKFEASITLDDKKELESVDYKILSLHEFRLYTVAFFCAIVIGIILALYNIFNILVLVSKNIVRNSISKIQQEVFVKF